MTTRYAFATLLTSNDYLPGALTIAAALNNVHRPLPLDRAVGYETVCLVTPEIVDVNAIRLLRKAFNVVIGVEVIAPPDADSLTLLGACPFLAFLYTTSPTHGIIHYFPAGYCSVVHVCFFPGSGPWTHATLFPAVLPPF